MSLSKEEILVSAQTAVSCNLCENESPGEHYCIKCKQTLCAQCKIIHGKAASSKDHNVVLRTQKGQIETRTLTCGDHGVDVIYHCEKCDIPVCGKCVTNKHRGHAMSDLDSLFHTKTDFLQKYVKGMQTKVLPILNKREEEISSGKEQYEGRIKQIQKEMKEENQALHVELDRIYDVNLQLLGTLEETDLHVFDRSASEMKIRKERYEKKIAEYQVAISKKSLPDVLEFSKCIRPLPVIGSNPEFPKPPSFAHGNFKGIENCVGTLQKVSKSEIKKQVNPRPATIVAKFQSPLNGWPSICISKNGNVFLGGKESKKLVMVDIKGQILWKTYMKRCTLALARMDCGDFIVSSDVDYDNIIRKLTPNEKEIHLLDASPSYCSGLSITPNQDIIFCIKNEGVFIMNGDGTNIQLVYECSGAGSVLHAIQTNAGDFFVTLFDINELVIITKYGTVSTLKETITGDILGELIGLTEDKKGNILCSDRTNHCIYIIDKDLQMRKLVDSSHGLRRPRWLAVDDKNNLWITQYDGTVVVMNY